MSTAILIAISAETGKAVSEIGRVNKALGDQQTMAEKVSGGIKKAAVPAGIAFAAISAGALSSVKSAEEAAVANNRLSQVYESMGYGDLAQGAIDYAAALQAQLGIDEDLTKSSMAKLATFEDVAASAELMEAATLTAANMSAAGFGDMESVSIGLGKALQDPIKGMTLLTKQGSLTKDEQAKIAEQFEKTGDKAAAQDSILAALEKQTGGVAESTATASDKMGLALGEIGEAVGTILLPAFEALTPLVEQFATWATDNAPAITIIGGVIAALAGTIIALNVAMSIWSAVTAAWSVVTAIATAVGGAFAAVVAVITSPVFLVIAAVVALIAIGVLLWKNWDTISKWLGKAWDWLWDKAVDIFNAIKEWIGGAWQWVKDKTVSIWNSVKAWLAAAWDGLKSKVSEVFTSMKNAAVDKLNALLAWVRLLPSKLVTALGNLTKTLTQKGKDLIQGLLDGAKTIFENAKTWLGDLGSKAANAIGNVSSALFQKGKDLIQGFIDGIKSIGSSVGGIIKDFIPGWNMAPVVAFAPTAYPSLAPTTRGGGYAAGGPPSVTINITTNDQAETARVVKRALEGYDIAQGRAVGAPLAVSW